MTGRASAGSVIDTMAIRRRLPQPDVW